ncbi:hypothetical protein ABA31_22260 [Agrococcus baldri]|uniref:Uncharacterized protein n=2 Tax=Agrococcus baldri TaxID=153730 RepID=A0AA87RII1_9MICO|nr:hypothetical protein ABA31_22260 [Agrococcus baldri]
MAMAARSSAVAEAREASAAVARAARRVDDARALIDLRGAEGWLGPARELLDARLAALRGRMAAEGRELELLAGAIEGAV